MKMLTRDEAWSLYRIALRRYRDKEIGYSQLMDAYEDLIGTW